MAVLDLKDERQKTDSKPLQPSGENRPQQTPGKSRRGFASMDENTRREIARRGGETVARERGSAFYSEIGRRGGERVARERGSEFYSAIGREGGRSRRASTIRNQQTPVDSRSTIERLEEGGDSSKSGATVEPFSDRSPKTTTLAKEPQSSIVSDTRKAS